jgi:hypothetical protein
MTTRSVDYDGRRTEGIIKLAIGPGAFVEVLGTGELESTDVNTKSIG